MKCLSPLLVPQRPDSYDMWSLGILVMELILGTAHVFQIDSRLRAFVDQQVPVNTSAPLPFTPTPHCGLRLWPCTHCQLLRASMPTRCMAVVQMAGKATGVRQAAHMYQAMQQYVI